MPQKTKVPSSSHSNQKPFPDSVLEMIAHRFRALAEPVRLRILSTLMTGEHNVSELVEVTGTSQANVSKHLSILKQAGMISSRRTGLNTTCAISDPAIFELCNIMCAKLKAEHAERSRVLA